MSGGDTTDRETEPAVDGAVLDPAELASLEDQRDHLLASLDDLEREFAVGDMDEADYLALKDDYTVRASDVLEAIEHRHSLTSAPTQRHRARAALVWIGVLVFAVVAGTLVARNAGQRGDGPITGGLNSLRADLARCQTTSLRDPAAGMECYEGILEHAPDNVEALTYLGWAQIRDGDVSAGSANLDRAVELDPDYPDARVFRAIVAFRAEDLDTAADEIDRFFRNDPTPAAVAVLQSQGLERELFIRTLGDETRECWLSAAAAGAEGGANEGGATGDEAPADATAFLNGLGECLDAVLATTPDDVDALVSRTYALLAGGGGSIDDGAALVDRALAADPDDPNARLMSASIALADGRTEDAADELEVLEGLRRPTISFLIGGPEQVHDALGQDVIATTSVPSTPDRATPSIPNRDGG